MYVIISKRVRAETFSCSACYLLGCRNFLKTGRIGLILPNNGRCICFFVRILGENQAKYLRRNIMWTFPEFLNCNAFVSCKIWPRLSRIHVVQNQLILLRPLAGRSKLFHGPNFGHLCFGGWKPTHPQNNNSFCILPKIYFLLLSNHNFEG